MSTTMQDTAKTRYVYDLDKLDQVPEGPCSAEVSARRRLSGKSTTTGPVLTGTQVLVGWMSKARGTGSKLHTHPNEQFNYVVRGTLIADMDGQVFRVPAGFVVHIPAGMVHSHVSTAEEDVIFIPFKDTRHGISGPAYDGKYDGPRTLPGFGTNNRNEWSLGPDGLPIPQSPRMNKEKICYVYDIDRLDSVPEGLCSAKVTPRANVTEKSSSSSAALTGDRLQVALIHKARGLGSKVHTQRNEQFIVVLQGTLQADIGGQTVLVPTHHAIHIPTGVAHSLVATTEKDVVFLVAKDTRHVGPTT